MSDGGGSRRGGGDGPGDDQTPAPPGGDGGRPRLPEVEPVTAELARVRRDGQLLGPSLLGSQSFFRLWLAQVVSSLGDWIGLVAILSLAARVGGASPEAAIALVMSARLVPGFFFGSVAGVLVDRWDRKRVMVTCDLGRGFVIATLPFIDTVGGLFAASLVLEVLTLLWAPAKEASVPNIVPLSRLTTANSLSLAAAYGTFPVGSALFASLAKVSEWVGRATPLDVLRLNQESLALYVDTATFFTSAVLIASLALPGGASRRRRGRIDLSRTFTDLREGFRFIGTSPVVRAVIVGLGTGLAGGGMVAPLGPTFANRVLDAGPAGFGLLLTALGCGLAVGVVGVSTIQSRIPHDRTFTAAVFGAGLGMLVAASMDDLILTMIFIAVMGTCTGAVYVLGFTILGENVEDELRGRIFATLYTLTRLCLLVSLAVAPLLAELLDGVASGVFDGNLSLGPFSLGLSGVRLTLWLGATVILVAGVLAARTLHPVGEASSPSEGGDEGPGRGQP